MTGYDLSRNWFDWTFENPEKISPNHTALYFFCIHHCNMLGWKKTFGLPTELAKEAIGIKSYNTYIKTLRDLIDFGFIKMVEVSKNQYTSNIIALSNNDKALDKALDKATLTHRSKHSESTSQSIDSINKLQTTNNKQQTNTPASPELNISFKNFYDLYDKKVGSKKSESLWAKLTNEERILAMGHVPKYKLSQPDKKFRKDPSTYLNNKSFNDEIIKRGDKLMGIPKNYGPTPLELKTQRIFNEVNPN